MEETNSKYMPLNKKFVIILELYLNLTYYSPNLNMTLISIQKLQEYWQLFFLIMEYYFT